MNFQYDPSQFCDILCFAIWHNKTRHSISYLFCNSESGTFRNSREQRNYTFNIQ
jgi:hypothetical protein